MELCFKIFDSKHHLIAEKTGLDEVNLLYTREYQEGDRVILESSEKHVPIWLQFDDVLGKSLVYITNNVEYQIPFGEKRCNFSPKAFCGTKHLLYARVARDFEIQAYRNLAVNVNDQHGETNCYPHASANVETRG